MAKVLCAIDGSPASQEALRAAVARCRDRSLELVLAVAVPDDRRDPPGPALGERVGRFEDVQYALVRAARAARAAGVRASLEPRADGREPVALAAALGATEVFVGRPAGRLRRAPAVDRIALPAREEHVALRPAAA